MANINVEKHIYINARPETVFSYFTDAEKLKRWLGKQVYLEPVVSGKVQIDMNGRDQVVGSFVSIQPYEHLLFTWGWVGSKEHPPGSSMVRVWLQPDSGGCWLHLQHVSVPEEERDCHESEWDRSLANLVRATEAIVHEQA